MKNKSHNLLILWSTQHKKFNIVPFYIVFVTNIPNLGNKIESKLILKHSLHIYFDIQL